MNHNDIAFTIYIPSDGKSTSLCLGQENLHGFEDLLKCCREVIVIKSPEGHQTLVTTVRMAMELEKVPRLGCDEEEEEKV